MLDRRCIAKSVSFLDSSRITLSQSWTTAEPLPEMPPSLKPSEVAAETKRHYIPYVRERYHDVWKAQSYSLAHPLSEVPWQPSPEQLSLTPPEFREFTRLPSPL